MIDQREDRLVITLSKARVTELRVGDERFLFDAPGNPFGYSPGLVGTSGAPCSDQPVPVRWRGFTPSSVTPASLLFSEVVGEFDPRACTAESRTRLDVRAEALIPGTLYAYRRCNDLCDPQADGTQRETLTVIAPPSGFALGSDGTVQEMTASHANSFSIVEIPVSPNHAASGTFALSIAAFERLPASERRMATVPPAVGVEIKIDVEVLGPSADDPAPSLTLHLSTRAASGWEDHLRSSPRRSTR
jgi:hypothetical protein